METRFAKTILNTISVRKGIKIFMFSRQNNRESEIIRKRLKQGALESIRIVGFEW